MHPGPRVSSSGCAPLNLLPHVLVYNRLEKTGSSTLYSIIDALAVRNNFTHVRLPEFYNASAARAAIGVALRQSQRSLVSEHFSFPEYTSSSSQGDLGRVSYMQVVRAPVDRCVSWYHWSRYSWDNPWTAGNRAAFGNASLDECLEEGLPPPHPPPTCLNCPPLHQAQSFCGANGGPCFSDHSPAAATDAAVTATTLSSQEVIGRALRHIEAHYPVVGLTERLEDTLALLEGTFPQFFAGALQVLRHPDFKSARVFKGKAVGYPKPSNATRRLLGEYLWGEEQLYSHLAKRLEQQHACRGAATLAATR